MRVGGLCEKSKLMRQCLAMKDSSRGSSRLALRRRDSRPMARYMAPVSRKSKESCSATMRATEDLPVPAGPSMVMIIVIGKDTASLARGPEEAAAHQREHRLGGD